MGLWNGNFLNTPVDIAIDTYAPSLLPSRRPTSLTQIPSILALLLALSHILQTTCITSKNSTYGLSPYYILLHTLFSNLQLNQRTAIRTVIRMRNHQTARGRVRTRTLL